MIFEERVEAMAAELHDQVYLPTAKALGWTVRPEVDVPYAGLSEDAKELDRVFARWHLAHLAAVEAESERRLGLIGDAIKQTDHQRQRAEAAGAALASVADCINQELRETGGCDASQIKDYLAAEEIKRAVRALVDVHRARLARYE